MGTHPIFESDFDCLTEIDIDIGKWIRGVGRKVPEMPFEI